ncbi:AzlD domain-containing protein [Acidithiobacillus sp. M4-SHS-6]|uniref:AzlD domain-containing protein n=1 Tax=Acidithiobacillus sp. M4-SHS-6 TaxID=3383024 RepID=UPI0039BE74B3
MVNPLGLVIAAAIGTFLLRFIPFLLAHKVVKTRRANLWWELFLERIGPAAIASLLIVSLSADLRVPSNNQMVAIGGALCVIVVVKRSLGGVAIATLTGALVYGLISWIYAGL